MKGLPHPESKLSAHLSVSVDMSELADWPAENIAALFAGVAEVRAAANKQHPEAVGPEAP